MTTISSQSRKKPSTNTKIIAVMRDSAPLEPSAAAAAEIIAWPPSRRKTSEKTLAPTKMKKIMALTDRKSTRLNSSHTVISYAVFCLKKKKKNKEKEITRNANTNRATRDTTK